MVRLGWSVLSLSIVCWLYSRSPIFQNALCVFGGWLPFSSYICSDLISKQWNLLEHLGGNGPWIPRASEGYEERLPMGCKVDQVHMIARHAERFPTTNAGQRHLALLDRFRTLDTDLTGSLGFVKDWKYFVNDSLAQFEEITREGPYAGTLQAHRTGVKLREKYNKLVNPNKTTNFWTCASSRDVDTAESFANGFFGEDWKEKESAKLHVIPETAERGGDTLTPGDTCLKYIDDKIYGHDRGYGELAIWQETFTKPIAERLSQEASGLAFSPLDIYSMMEMCGFELLARGSSPWCQVFSHREWLDFEYGRDLLHFYRAGPGNDYAGAMGWLWLNATTTLLSNDEVSGVYFSFVHDGDIIPLVTTLGILEENKSPGFLPNDKSPARRRWKTSNIVPMGGRLVFERVTCHNTGLGGNLRRSYVRLFINDGIVDLAKSMVGSGLSYSVGMAQWKKFVHEKGQKYGSFKEVCGLSGEAPRSITFLQPQ